MRRELVWGRAGSRLHPGIFPSPGNSPLLCYHGLRSWWRRLAMEISGRDVYEQQDIIAGPVEGCGAVCHH